jgi:hypothetical protein
MALIRSWSPAEIQTIEAGVRAAVVASGIIGTVIPFRPNSKNQSKGNQAADFFLAQVPPHLAVGATIRRAKGAGYPDLLLTIGTAAYCMESKATSNWNSRDDNRRVLTSSSTKMRALVAAGPAGVVPAHLIATLIYDEATSVVQTIRLDFLEPNSPVKVRLEGSTSQQLLAGGAHAVKSIP